MLGSGAHVFRSESDPSMLFRRVSQVSDALSDIDDFVSLPGHFVVGPLEAVWYNAFQEFDFASQKPWKA